MNHSNLILYLWKIPFDSLIKRYFQRGEMRCWMLTVRWKDDPKDTELLDLLLVPESCHYP